MTQNYTVQDLSHWEEVTREKAEEYGLNCNPQDFDLCDHNQMISLMTYSGMPAHYPHWSYGKSAEKTRTLYDRGVMGLPYEMVINSNPSLAYLMSGNSLSLQILTMAHVYGHNDFFKNNFTFKHTRPELTIGNFKMRADMIREFIEQFGFEKVEKLLDASHALAYQCRRNLQIRKLSHKEQRERAHENSLPKHDPFQNIHKRQERVEVDDTKLPVQPEEDILLFIAENNPHLKDWERFVMETVHNQAQYFIPQIETKIMNEGWACYWHHKIMTNIDLPESLFMEFLVNHNQVVRPHPGTINPYYLGYKIWHDIFRRQEEPTAEEIEEHGKPTISGNDMIFDVRKSDRDTSFLRRFLTENLMREMDMFEYERKGDEVVVSKISDEDNWKDIKKTLVRNVGMGSFPVIKIIDANFSGSRGLLLCHEDDGRELHHGYAKATLAHLESLWGGPVFLETIRGNKKYRLRIKKKDGVNQLSLRKIKDKT